MSMKKKMELNGTVPVVVRADAAEDGGAHDYEWHGCLGMQQPLSVIAAEWAGKHGVPAAAVGFDDASGTEMSLSATPAGMNWRVGVEVELKAYPKEEQFMESEPAAPAKAMVSSAPTPSRGAAKKVPPVTPSRLEAKKAAPAVAVQVTNPDAADNCQAKCQANPPVTTGRGASAKSAAAAAAKGKAAAGKSAAPAIAAPSTPSNPSTPAGSKRKSPFAPSPATPATPSSDSVPSEADAIAFQQDNPKREGTSAHERYEKYKKAKTVTEALALGACKADVSFDFKKGFLTRRK